MMAVMHVNSLTTAHAIMSFTSHRPLIMDIARGLSAGRKSHRSMSRVSVPLVFFNGELSRWHEQ